MQMFNKALAGLKKIGKSLQGPEALAPHSDVAVSAAATASRVTSGAPGNVAPCCSPENMAAADSAVQRSTSNAVANETANATAHALWVALGGQANVRAFKTVACTRLRVELLDAAQFNPQQAQQAGVLAVAHVAGQVIHLIVGLNAAQLEVDLRAACVMER
jgi:phosphotransferase system IIB component